MIETRVCFGLEGKMVYRECGTNMGGLNPGSWNISKKNSFKLPWIRFIKLRINEFLRLLLEFIGILKKFERNK